MHKKNSERIIYLLLIALIVVSICNLIIMLLKSNIRLDYGSLLGGIIGGIITLSGVLITIWYNQEFFYLTSRPNFNLRVNTISEIYSEKNYIVKITKKLDKFMPDEIITEYLFECDLCNIGGSTANNIELRIFEKSEYIEKIEHVKKDDSTKFLIVIKRNQVGVKETTLRKIKYNIEIIFKNESMTRDYSQEGYIRLNFIRGRGIVGAYRLFAPNKYKPKL